MRRNKPKTQKDLFIYVLNKWLDNEYQCISEWGIGNREKMKADARKEYEDCLNLWEKLRGGGLALCDKCDYFVTVEEAYRNGKKDGRKNAIDECIALARAEIDFESPEEQKRFVEFMEQLKEENDED